MQGKKNQELKVPLMWCIFILGYFSFFLLEETQRRKNSEDKGLYGAQKVKNS
jgi:hypothetical protein